MGVEWCVKPFIRVRLLPPAAYHLRSAAGRLPAKRKFVPLTVRVSSVTDFRRRVQAREVFLHVGAVKVHGSGAGADEYDNFIAVLDLSGPHRRSKNRGLH